METHKLRIKNVKFSGHRFYMNTNIKRDFKICISVTLKGKCFCIFLLTEIIIRKMSKKYHLLCAKTLWRFGKRRSFFITPWWQQKVVFEWTLSSSTFFISEQIFVYLSHFIQAASLLWRKYFVKNVKWINRYYCVYGNLL